MYSTCIQKFPPPHLTFEEVQLNNLASGNVYITKGYDFNAWENFQLSQKVSQYFGTHVWVGQECIFTALYYVWLINMNVAARDESLDVDGNVLGLEGWETTT